MSAAGAGSGLSLPRAGGGGVVAISDSCEAGAAIVGVEGGGAEKVARCDGQGGKASIISPQNELRGVHRSRVWTSVDGCGMGGNVFAGGVNFDHRFRCLRSCNPRQYPKG